ncbi:hypothetical protein ACLMJK_002381 [Lecanora helva]
MDSTSVEDFQHYHNYSPNGETDAVLNHDYPNSGLHDNDDDAASLSGSAHHSPDEAVFDHPTRTSSPRTSHGSDDDISVLESHYDFSNQKPPPFTPPKTRSRFRNPSSVRVMQMDRTPPRLVSPSSQPPNRLYTPSRQGTPRSARSHRSAMSSPSKLSPTKKMKKEYPLVLLHVTLLPIPSVYSQETMESVLPPSILENWKILREKATDTVLERGILIPHPREDYDLLEERLLESLELKIPRILKCGHFRLSPEEEEDILNDSDNDDPEDTEDLDICHDCGRRIRDGKFGSAGTGSKRWDIKLFAANGLMRAGAWSAAWKEMERVDVEILPWMEEDMKRELDLRREEEERTKAEIREEGVGGLDDERLREIYGGEAQAFVDGRMNETPATVEMAARQEDKDRARGQEVPLWDLFCNYIRHVAQDRRNIAIFILSLLVVLLSMGPFRGTRSNDISDTSNSIKRNTQDVSTASSQRSIVPTSVSSANSVPLLSSILGSVSSSSTESQSSSSPSSVPGPSDSVAHSQEDQAVEPTVSPASESVDDEVSEILED